MTGGIIFGLIFFSIMLVAVVTLIGVVIRTAIKERYAITRLLLIIICMSLLNYAFMLIVIIHTVLRSTL